MKLEVKYKDGTKKSYSTSAHVVKDLKELKENAKFLFVDDVLAIKLDEVTYIEMYD